VENFVGRGNAIYFIVEYDVKEVILLMTIFYYLNPIVQTMSIVPSDGHNGVAIEIKEEDIDIFGVRLSMEKSSRTCCWRIVSISKVIYSTIQESRSSCLVVDPRK
jgi:hypothetical protein